MKRIDGIEQLPEQLRGGVVSLGKFDGIHLGHAAILRRMKEYAERFGVPSLVLTFDPPPTALLSANATVPLCTLERKLELIRDFGIDAAVVVSTTSDFLRQSAEDFFFQTLVKRLQAKVIVEGENFSFGHARSGNAEAMRRMGQQAGIAVELVESVRLGKLIISSSEIRRQLLSGNICDVNAMLSKPYRLSGTVVHGEHRGRTLGFPTANLGGVQTIVPKAGIYATRAWVDGTEYLAATHIGTNPTFDETVPKIEVFLLDFDGDLYEKTLHVDFLDYLREIVRFGNVDELLRHIKRDVAMIRKESALLSPFPQSGSSQKPEPPSPSLTGKGDGKSRSTG